MAFWLMPRRAKLGRVGLACVLALAVSVSWSITAGATGTESAGTYFAESVRNIAWLAVVWMLFETDGRNNSIKAVRPLVVALGAVEIIAGSLLILLHRPLSGFLDQDQAFEMMVSFRLIFTIGGLVLLHNLYSGASKQARLALRWPAAGLAVLWIYDLNIYTVAWIAGYWPEGLAALRGLSLACGALFLLPALAKRQEELHFSPSRMVTFQSVALLGIGGYFGVMLLASQLVHLVGPKYANLFQFGLFIAASTLAVMLVPSKRLRSWVKVVLTKHLFRHRYDYRTEWLRFAGTIGRSGENALPLEQRAVQAVAQITESPAGLLLVPGDSGDFVLSSSWQWRLAEVPAIALDAEAARLLEQTGFIVELDQVRAGKDHRGERDVIPAWLRDDPQAWVIVPLLHYERLVGLVVLARPANDRALDWEDFDVLRVIGQQLATTLAEHTGQDALAEAARFDEFNRRIAFVMHDIKNLASQFGLLARNAELHADNPEFRADMLVTLRSSADKLNALIARLSRYGAGGSDRAEKCDAAELVERVAQQFASSHQVNVVQRQGGELCLNREGIEQALIHLVQNAIDASDRGTPVFIDQSTDGLTVTIQIVDSGVGMSPEFVRTRLFRPFVSSKPGGFGIGAFEARELVRAAKGRLDVESREGLGTRFIMRLPLATTAELLSGRENQNWKVA
ncbi:XrtA/PEP-CTERM system histidine kinase PrsK [Novosphingobium sp.]|uniref:XrtA/PEP-CTERM system histidine kinase PrsK n=1 Tax=Novosphingobium sp. TaxID=1874826 RepID=UPI00286E0133|nr:XrtA/PEP-CTERM system histidine kinase PrsK [Novosphingobium sp.]